VSKMTVDKLETAEHMVRRSLNIAFEWNTLVEAQQIIDELQILQGIFAQQIAAMTDLEKDLKALAWQNISFKQDDDPEDIEEVASVRQRRALDRLSGLVADMQQRRDELKSMEELQTKTRTQV
jgi:hypothetical protein